MDIDPSRDNFILNDNDRRALRLSPDRTHWPVANAESLLCVIEERRRQLQQIDVSEYPQGAARTEMQGRLVSDAQIILDAIHVVRPHLPPVSEDIEQFLRQNQ